MRSDKIKRAIDQYNGFRGEQTLKNIMDIIPTTLCDQLVGRQIGVIMSAINAAYHYGKNDGTREIAEYIGLPSDVSLWAVIGDDNYPDGLNIPDILVSRGYAISEKNKNKMEENTK